MSNTAFIIERTFSAPIKKVWKAITDKDEMKKWYFDIAAFQPIVGFEFTFSASNEGREYVHLCKITEIIEGKKLAYSWRYKDHEGNSVVSFELFDEGGKTRLKLTHEGIESFSNNGKDFKKESFAEGWTYIIGKSLSDYLETINQ